MLGKLIKHEFRATARIMLPMLAALIALSLLANLSVHGLAGNLSNVPVLRIVFIVIVVFFAIAVVATAVMTLVIMISRFYRNLMKDEGYLMFTLPVSVHELIWSKLIVSLVWFLAAGLVITLVMALNALNLSAINMNLNLILLELPSWAEIRQKLQELGIYTQLFTLGGQSLLIMLLGVLATCLHFYASMSLGHMFSKDKIVLSVVFFIAISFAFSLMQTGQSAVLLPNMVPELFTGYIDTPVQGLRVFSALLWQGIILSAVEFAVLYVITVLSLKKGLNLS